jgi:asparagine synthase (glutamine-hydrolysing)
MCGIAGGIDDQRDLSGALGHSLGEIAHRGPDDEGRHVATGVAIGMRRLAVIDRSSGRQPLFNEDHSVAVVFNGEIYNYRDLLQSLRAGGHGIRTASDTEALVHLYEDHGEDMCRHLRGMFAFAIWDGRLRRLFMARDRLGKKPLYLARTPGGLVFASELKALLPLMRAGGLGTPRLDQRSLYDYLSLGCVPQPRTIYEGVTMLPPATWCSADASGIRSERYWSPGPATEERPPSYADALIRTRELVGDAVRARLQSEVPLGVFLSGGLDSTVVAYEAARAMGGDLRTFTVGVRDRHLDESAVASRTARTLGIRHQVLALDPVSDSTLLTVATHFDQPFADPSAIPSFAISRAARQFATVVLNGDGGDEAFGGYRRHVAAAWAPWLRYAPAGLVASAAGILARFSTRRRSPLGFASRFARGLATQNGDRYLHWTTDLLKEDLKSRIWLGEPQPATESWLATVPPDGPTPLRRQMATDRDVNLVSGLLVKMDMASMAASLEARSPLLDHALFEFTAGLPDSYLVRGGRGKRLLRDSYADSLPAEVVVGAKKGFEIPLRDWLATDLRPMVVDLLGRPSAFVRRWLDGRFIDRLLTFEPFPDMRWEGIVYSLLVLELWAEHSPIEGIVS